MSLLLLLSGLSLMANSAYAASAAEIDTEVELALEKLYVTAPAAVELSKVAKGILVFPDVIKAGLIIGGQYGDGGLVLDGKIVDY